MEIKVSWNLIWFLEIYETHNGIKINFDEKNGYFGKQTTNKNLIKTNISKTKLIKKISSRDFKMSNKILLFMI